MALNDVAPAGSGQQKRTFLIFNRSTGDVVSVHHMSAAAGVDLPDERVLETQALRTASTESASQELGVIAYDGRDVDLPTLHVDVRTLRVISRDTEHRSR